MSTSVEYLFEPGIKAQVNYDSDYSQKHRWRHGYYRSIRARAQDGIAYRQKLIVAWDFVGAFFGGRVLCEFGGRYAI